MHINHKSAGIGALGAALVLTLTVQAQADQRREFIPGASHRHGYTDHGFGARKFGDHDRFGEFGHHRRFAHGVIGGVYVGGEVAVGADYQSAPGYAEPAYAAPQGYASASQVYSQAYGVPTVVYRPVTQTYTAPVHSYRYVQRTHYVPVTSYQAVTTTVAVPVTTYQTYQRTVEEPQIVYQPAQSSCGCAYSH